MGNNIKEFYLNAANNFHKPIKSTKKSFDIKSCSTEDLKSLKKLINIELKSRRSKRFWNYINLRIAFWSLLITVIAFIISNFLIK